MKNIKYFLNTTLNIISSVILSSTLVVGILAGCASQWNQDPLADKDGVLKTGQPKPTQPEERKAIDSNNVVVDSPELYAFREGTLGELVVTARILENGYAAAMSVENLADFPGANFAVVNYDSATRIQTAKFTWTPAFGVVSGNSGLDEKKDLKLLILGSKPNSKVIVGHRSVKVSIGKMLNVPEIFSISQTSISLREGEKATLNLKIRDKDAGIDVKSYPNLLILPTVGYADPSQFVTINQIVATGSGEFTVFLGIDLTSAELTKSRGIFSFNLKAVSRFNQVSSAQSVLLNIVTSFSDLQSSWYDVLETPAGSKTTFQFMIFDPKTELSVSNPNFSGLPSNATVNCSAVGTNQLCTFSWTPDLSVPAGDYSFQAQVTGRSQDPQDTFVKNNSFNLKLRVTSAPPVSPLALQGGK
ncbi:MAG TPA: hypothetical protein VIG33_07065 [Pseudobdellovibrionaceae bacterium]|jgi:hypothetical protein